VSWTDGLTGTQKAALLHSLGRLQQHLRSDQGQPNFRAPPTAARPL
jgi:hypothetical protein